MTDQTPPENNESTRAGLINLDLPTGEETNLLAAGLKALAGSSGGPLVDAVEEFLGGKGELLENTRSVLLRNKTTAEKEVAEFLEKKFNLSPVVAALVAPLVIKLVPALAKSVTGSTTSTTAAKPKPKPRKKPKTSEKETPKKPKTSTSRTKPKAKPKTTTSRKKPTATAKKPAAKKKTSKKTTSKRTESVSPEGES